MRTTAITTLIFTSLLSGCGAPTQSAASVSSLFKTSRTIQGMASDLCSILDGRTEAPSTQNFKMKLQGCQRAGESALDYSKISSFGFVNLDGSAPSKTADSTDKTTAAATNETPTSGATTPSISRQNRAQIWLNKSLLDMASTLTAYMKQNQLASAGEIKLPDSSTSGLANLAKLSVTMVAPPTLDIANLAFSMRIRVAVSGVVKVNLLVNIDGKLINNAFALTIKSSEDIPYEQSLVKNIEVVALVIPYAKDIYLDVYSNVEVYDLGVKSVINSQLDSFWSTGLKGIIDTLVLVQGDKK